MPDSSASPAFHALLEAAPDAMVLIDQRGAITHVNSQVEVLFGYARGELLGQPVEMLMPPRFRGQHPKHRSAYFAEPRKRPMGAAGVALVGLRKDGTEFPAEVSLSPIDIEGSKHVIAAIRDGTAHRQVEARFRRLLEAAPDAMVIADQKGNIVLVNQQAQHLFGYAQEEMLGKPVEMLIPERYRAAHPAHRQRYFSEQRVRPMGAGGLALFGLRKDGTEFPAEISLSPLESEEGPLAITAIRDVSDVRKAERERAKLNQAQEAIRMRDEFLSIASHELKTPLTAIQLQIEGLIRGARRLGAGPAWDPSLQRLDVLNTAVHRLGTLINQLLDLSRITAGRLSLERDDVNLVSIVRRVMAMFGDEAARVGCSLTLHAPDNDIRGAWDPLRIEQIVTNLLSNAIKYGQGRPVEVAVSQVPDADGGRARLMVRDFGIGIAPEHQARIFERFERLLSTRNYGGFGLGLWIVRQIIEAHGGIIRVSSEPGAGSTFTVELPTRPRDTALVSTESAPSDSVLLVDDDTLIRSSFSQVLGDEGFHVVTAANGVEALHMLRSGLRPKLIFLDLTMPVMDGWALRRELQADPNLAHLPVVLLSAAQNAREQVAALGVEGCVTKPIDLEQVLVLAERYCGRAEPPPPVAVAAR